MFFCVVIPQSCVWGFHTNNTKHTHKHTNTQTYNKQNKHKHKQTMNLERKFFIVSEPTEFYSVLINSEEASERYIRSIIKQDKIDVFVKEYFYVIGLKTNNETNGYMKISDGGIDKTIIEITHIAKFLINNNCTKYILFHNHPSGNLKESTIDINITNQIKIAMDLFQIRILDHIIIAGDNYLSFVNKGLL